jgi:exopolysaccharide biosynthesis polyprenyl glycosylphosphotransferase
MKRSNDERTQNSARFLINAIEIFILTVVFWLIWFKFYRNYVYYFFRGNLLIVALYAGLLIIFNSMYEGFQIGYKTTGDLIFSQILSLVFANLIIFLQVTLMRKHMLPFGEFFIYLLIEIGITVFLNILINRIYYRIFPPRKTWMICNIEDPSIRARISKYQANAYEIVRENSFAEAEKHLEDLKNYDCVLAAGLSPEEKNVLVNRCYRLGNSIYILPDIYDVILNSAKNVYLVDTPVLKANRFGPSQIEKVIKRIWDILFAVFFLVLTSPIMLVTAICIKAEDGGPVFYKQTRLTQYGRTFEIIKFRSMKVDAEKDGVARLAAENDDRITKVGRKIRASRIDELPQLINILKGDMSVVGPRPERPEIVEQIEKDLPEFNYRLKVKAGLTGYAQVYGKYNTKLRDKLLFDLIYIENFSIILDIRIMFMTFKIIFKKDSTEGVDEGQIVRE